MARDFIFRIKKGQANPPADPVGYRLLLNDDTGELKLLTSENKLIDIPTTGSTSSSGGGINSFTYNDANRFTIIQTSGASFSADINILTGLTVNGDLTIAGVTNGTFYGDGSNLSGVSTSDYFVTGFTYDANTFTIYDNSGNTFNATINEVTGLTVNGDLIVTGVTNLQGLNTTTTNINGDLNVTGNLTITGETSLSNLNLDGLTATTIYATTYQNLPLDVYVTGGTFNTNTDTITLARNDGGSVDITGLTDYYVTGFTYSNNTFSIKDNSGSTFSSTINTMTGLTINGDLIVTGNTNVKALTATTTNINGNLTVTGGTSLQALTATTTNINGDLTVTGGTSLQTLTATTTNINGGLTVSGTTNLSGTTNQVGNFTLKNSNSSNTGTVLFDTSQVTGTTNTVSFQNQSGTVALLSDLSSGEPNSKGYYYMENNAVATVCTSNASFYKISGTTSTIPGYLKLFTTGSSSNQLVYNYPFSTGSTLTYLKYNVSLSVQTAGGGLTLNFQLRKNGSPIPITLTTNTQGTNQPTAINLTGIVSAQYNDVLELFVNCTTNTSNVLVTDLTVSFFT